MDIVRNYLGFIWNPSPTVFGTMQLINSRRNPSQVGKVYKVFVHDRCFFISCLLWSTSWLWLPSIAIIFEASSQSSSLALMACVIETSTTSETSMIQKYLYINHKYYLFSSSYYHYHQYYHKHHHHHHHLHCIICSDRHTHNHSPWRERVGKDFASLRLSPLP